MTFLIFRNREEIKWLPGERVLMVLDSNQLVVTRHGECRMACRGISLEEVKQLIKDGDVNFSKSEPHSEPCKKYAVEGKTKDGQEIRVIFGACARETRVITAIDLNSEKDTCECK